MKKKIPVIVVLLFLLSLATLIFAGDLDACHQKCAKLYPDSKAKYDACFVGCMAR